MKGFVVREDALVLHRVNAEPRAGMEVVDLLNDLEQSLFVIEDTVCILKEYGTEKTTRPASVALVDDGGRRVGVGQHNSNSGAVQTPGIHEQIGIANVRPASAKHASEMKGSLSYEDCRELMNIRNLISYTN